MVNVQHVVNWLRAQDQHASAALIELLVKERDHWKANHAEAIKRQKILLDRPDLPIERVRAYEEMVRLQETIKELLKSKKDLTTIQ